MPRLCIALLGVIALAGAACRDEGTVLLNRLRFTGVTAVDERALRGVLATRERARIAFVGIPSPSQSGRRGFESTRFEADLLRIRAFYADRGYPRARVVKSDIVFNHARDAVNVTVAIDEGAPTRIAGVSLAGFESLPADVRMSLGERLSVRAGQVRDRAHIASSHDDLVETFHEHGYPFARVAVAESPESVDHQVAISFRAEPGELAHFGPVEIVGNRGVDRSVIARQLAMPAGAPYRRSLVRESQRRLYGLELFQFVTIEPLASQGATMPMRVTVVEGRHQRVNGGVGHGTEEKLRLHGEYRHLNFAGGARSLGARARWSSLDRGLRVDVKQPALFSTRLSLTGEAQHWYTEAPAYTSRVTGARASWMIRARSMLATTVFIGSERNVSRVSSVALADPSLYTDLIALGLDAATGTQEGTLSTVGTDVEFTHVDSLLDPRRGYHLDLHAEQAGRFLPGSFNFRAASADVRIYTPVGSRASIGLRTQAGGLWPAGDDAAQVPFSKKPFLGGATSLRGWGRYEASPLSASGLPIGGNALVASSAELRVRGSGRLGAVVFVDAGRVWDTPGHVDLGALYADWGAGLRYTTPVGPLRVDIGRQLSPIPGLVIDGKPQERPWRLHFSIGQAF